MCASISSEAAVVGLIGHPVGHSVSPIFQQAAFDALGLAFRYEAWDTTADRLAARVVSLRDHPFAGANVTVPHKEAVVPLLAWISDEAMSVGAVNTIVRDRDRLLGYNTDIAAFLDALRYEGGFDVRGVRACVLGAGGAARAAVCALLSGGAGRVSVYNRTPERAEALVSSLDPGDGRLVAAGGDAGKAVAGCDLIVNCTSLGMAGSARADASPLTEAQIPPGAFVYDIVANPAVTPLLASARSRGCRTLGGLPMLVRQGAAAFTLWTGHPAPLDVMFRAARGAMSPESEVLDAES